MFDLPTAVWPFFFAVVAAVAGFMIHRRPKDDPGGFPERILYALAVACVILGFVAIWLDRGA